MHDRLVGYRRALAAAGLTPVGPDDMVLFPILRQWRGSRTRSRNGCCASGRKGSLPTAIFACDYLMTLATLRVLRRHGLRVPEDISLVGFDDPLSAAHLTPPLTTVRQPVYRLGRRAAQRLLQALQGQVPPARHGNSSD